MPRKKDPEELVGKRNDPAKKKDPTARTEGGIIKKGQLPEKTPPAKPETIKAKKTGKNHDFLVVGIGASAGGINALREFFAAMPPNSGMAFVVVLHLSPTHESSLDQILQAVTVMPVQQVTGTMRVEKNSVYVIPPNRNLVMVDGTVRLAKPVPETGSRVAIDLLFRTLSESYGRQAVCVVMSGTGTDGTLGLKAIKGRNGFAIVQSPEDAEYQGMPNSAIETKLADVILPAAQIPEKLLSVRDTTEKFKLAEDDENIVPPVFKGDEALREILTLVRVRTGHDFSNYKHPTLLRRIARHLQIHDLDDMNAYLAVLREKPEEVQSLVHNLLINVTNFFRDKKAFEALEETVIPQLFEGKHVNDQIRVWTAGCASGEEAYSLAMLLAEHASTLPDPPKIQIFASDVDEDAIAQAREGRYLEAITTDVSPERLKAFFVKEGAHYRVKKMLREMVLFAPHNILRDPPFSRIDLISCRNVLIYLNRETQDRVLQVFHFALKPTGFLFLGSSETADGQSALFAPMDKKNRIYTLRSARGVQKLPPPMPEAGRWSVRIGEKGVTRHPVAYTFGEMHYKLIEQYAPPSILVDSDFEIVHMSDSAGRFLSFSGGEPSHNLTKLINPDLLPDLRAGLFSCQHDGKTAEFRNIRTQIEGKASFVNLIVRPVNLPDFEQNFLLVILDETGAPVPEGEEVHTSTETVASEDAMETVVRRLEEELRRTKERLRATNEQNETSVEELKASNEELQAINEELRSATEELETSKEELQSVNEELTTVNTELKEKVDEVSKANADLENLMGSTDIGTIFLDRDLRVKLYTPHVADLFNIIPGDLGRPIDHITHRLTRDDFASDARKVLKDLKTVEREVDSDNGRSFLVRFSPYRAADDRINGVVIAFIDITDRKRTQNVLDKTHRDLKKHAGELERFNKAAVGREVRMIDLKREINDLYKRLGEKPPYNLDFADRDKGDREKTNDNKKK